MIPLTIEEILELPIGSQVFVERKATTTVYRDHFFYCKVLSLTDEKIELALEVEGSAHSFHDIALGKALDETIIHNPDFDITEQLFLDQSGVDRVYSDRSKIVRRPLNSWPLASRLDSWLLESRSSGFDSTPEIDKMLRQTFDGYLYMDILYGVDPKRSLEEAKKLAQDQADLWLRTSGIKPDSLREAERPDTSEIVSLLIAGVKTQLTQSDKPNP
jgi:hypothetical protein